MLLKLCKYELKAQSRLYGGIYIIVALLGLISLIFKKLNERDSVNIVFQAMHGISAFILILSVILMFMGTFIIAILRFRSNLLKDEGYLMHTLPVPVRNLYLSKFVTPLIWLIIDCILVYFIVSFHVWDFGWPGIIVNEIQEKSDFHVTVFHCIGMLLYLFILVCQFLNSVYLSLSVGFASTGNKDILSFAVFVGTYMLSQITNILGFVVIGIVKFGSMGELFGMETVPFTFIRDAILSAAGISITYSVLFTLVSIYFLKSRLNLE